MAGRPKLKALVEQLEKRTRADFEDDTSTHLDYICAWIESGNTMVELAGQITKAAGIGDITSAMIRRHLMNMWPKETDRRIQNARTVGAHAQVEKARQITDEASSETREQLTHAKMKADVRLWSASRANKAELGNGGDINVVINHNELHLDSMRVRKLQLEQEKTLREIEADLAPARLSSASSLALEADYVIIDDIVEDEHEAKSLTQLGLGL